VHRVLGRGYRRRRYRRYRRRLVHDAGKGNLQRRAGSVLLIRPVGSQLADELRIRQSVSQAAPVLANLRNLAIAEIRASTDSLTGLPNKRAVVERLVDALRRQAPGQEPRRGGRAHGGRHPPRSAC
jgi:GGDEF domain-containing protein